MNLSPRGVSTDYETVLLSSGAPRVGPGSKAQDCTSARPLGKEDPVGAGPPVLFVRIAHLRGSRIARPDKGQSDMRVLVLGGGIIGTSSAWFLRAAGHDVALIERAAGVARETSFANGGQISVSHAEPWANPATPLKVMKWLGRSDAPLLFRIRPELHQWTWALAFLRECLPARTARNIRHNLRLATYSRTLLRELRQELALDYDHLSRGILHFYTSAAEFEASLASAALMRELGCDRRPVDADEAVRIEPALAPLRDRIVGADYCAEDESGDAARFTEGLARAAEARGVQFSFNTQVTKLVLEAGRIRGVETVGGDGRYRLLAADVVIVALGVHSRALLAPLGIRLPLYPGKGYSATYDIVDAARAPTVSLTDDEFKLVFSRLGARLRVAGTAELSGYDRSLNEARCASITRRAQALFPGVCDYARPNYWAGLRPATPSGVPLIGATPISGLYVNTGHGTLGWTMGVGSGKLLADLVDGRATDIEPPPLPWQ
jgi:D-amino-acid dehydrogenase